jgi:hypothetical protein
MTGNISVFVNGSLLTLPEGTTVAEALRAFDPSLERGIADGSAYVTDARGLEISTGDPLASGAILRAVVRSRRGVDVDADA